MVLLVVLKKKEAKKNKKQQLQPTSTTTTTTDVLKEVAAIKAQLLVLVSRLDRIDTVGAIILWLLSFSQNSLNREQNEIYTQN
jgi:Co/Zn/Cd efflux system component